MKIKNKVLGILIIATLMLAVVDVKALSFNWDTFFPRKEVMPLNLRSATDYDDDGYLNDDDNDTDGDGIPSEEDVDDLSYDNIVLDNYPNHTVIEGGSIPLVNFSPFGNKKTYVLGINSGISIDETNPSGVYQFTDIGISFVTSCVTSSIIVDGYEVKGCSSFNFSGNIPKLSWGQMEETKVFPVVINASMNDGTIDGYTYNDETKTALKADSTTKNFNIIVQRDTDNDGNPDVTDPDDDDDGYDDEVEIDAGTNPKDPNSFPTKADLYKPIIQIITGEVGVDIDEITAVTNIPVDGIPSVSIQVDHSTVGNNKPGEVTVEFDDGSVKTIPILANIVDSTDPVLTVNPNTQTVIQKGNTPVDILPVTVGLSEEATVTIENASVGVNVNYNPGTSNITGTVLIPWSPTEEERIVTFDVVATDDSNNIGREKITVIVKRDTDSDGKIDETDQDDDNDGWSDQEENDAGTNPKDNTSYPNPVISVNPPMQTVIEDAQITPIKYIVPPYLEQEVIGVIPNLNDDNNGNITGSVDINNWGPTEEERNVTITVNGIKDNGDKISGQGIITVERDTDKDGIPDKTDSDDDGDGFSDQEENDAGTNPKDETSKPDFSITISPKTQTILEYTNVTPIVYTTPNWADTSVTGIPSGLTDNNKTITGIPAINDWGPTEEERPITITVKVTKDDGQSITDTAQINVQRDTDKDSDPDITDPDDDGDGYTDAVENDAGTDPKDPNSYPGKVNIVITPPTQKVLDNKPIVEISYTHDAWIEDENITTPTGLTGDITTNKINGSIDVTNWGPTEEERTFSVVVSGKNAGGEVTEEEATVIVQRDTDNDGDPDITDPDDDGDGYTDEEENDAGTDPKDPNSKPGAPLITINPPTQTVLDNKPITTITYTISSWGKNINVDVPIGLVNNANKTVTGSIDVNNWGAVEETRTFTVTVTAKNNEGLTGSKSATINVLRDTDNDGDPDTTDPDDDGDGFSDEEEIDAGTDPKDPDSYPKEADLFVPNTQDLTVEINQPVDIIEGLLNPPANATITVKTPVDTSTVGVKTGVITITFSDGSPKDVPIKVIVVNTPLGLTVNPLTQQVIENKPINNINIGIKQAANVTITIPTEFKPIGGVVGNNVTMTGNSGTVSATTEVNNWGPTEEQRIISVTVTGTSQSDPTLTDNKSTTIVILRDTDKDNNPDITDPDDDGDGFSDEEENEAGTDPKDPNSFPTLTLTVNPKTQDIIETNPITSIIYIIPDFIDDVEVNILVPGITVNKVDKTISGTPVINDWGKTEEIRPVKVEITIKTSTGTEKKEEAIINVKRDTDKDGDPDVTDPDDDGDGFSDEEEIDAGTDPKDPNSKPSNEDAGITNPQTGIKSAVLIIISLIVISLISFKVYQTNKKHKYFN